MLIMTDNNAFWDVFAKPGGGILRVENHFEKVYLKAFVLC